MAFLAVTSLMRTLEVQFLHPQPRVILSNKEQIESVHEKLGHLLVFLENFEKSAHNLPLMRAVTKQIIDVTVKAEDDIEADLLKVHPLHKLDDTLQRIVDGVEELMQITMNTSDLVNSNILTTIYKKMKKYYFFRLFLWVVGKVIENLKIFSNVVGGFSSQHTSHVEENAMVGHSEKLDEVMSQLFGDINKPLQVMALVGMGGIGKTTFVKKIYDDPRVKSHFDLCAWTTMSLEHNKGQAILDLCRCVKPSSSAFNNIEMEDDLGAQLRKSLLGHRYLIIVDDIWTTDAWDDIQRCLPDDDNGSKILLTTRARDVARYAGSGEYSYNMRFLNRDEGWNLFYHKFLDKELFQKDAFRTIGMKIVEKCGGLPLTVVVMAGLLSKIKQSIDEWENVEKNLNSLVALDLNEQFSRILTLSYNNLPSHLKVCFLYLGVFHEDSEIPVKKLIRLWIAEGFAETIMRHRKRPEEVGRDYLQDLIDRSLVMVNERSFDGEIKTCRMHDLLHELCTSKAKNENLLYLETTGSRHSFDSFVQLTNHRWLSLKVVNPDFHISISSKKWRSILCFNSCGRAWYLLATSFRKLRVLDLSKVHFKSGMPQDITMLVFLRYLALASSSRLLNHIPLCKNWNLQTLIISEDDNENAHELPHGIRDKQQPHGIWGSYLQQLHGNWDLKQLRHLEICHEVSIDLLNDARENLQTLYWLSTSQCTMEVFRRIPNVKELGIIVVGPQVSLHGLNNLCYHLGYLEKLRVQGSDEPLDLPPGFRFPYLKELTFVSTRIPWEAMSIISMLPNLELLKLKNFACTGQEWELTRYGGFPRLKVLIISLTDLKEWKAYAYHFPKLERLLLKKCFELKEMPDWIEDSFTLRLIKLVYCYASLVQSANQIKEEQLDNYGNDMLDVLDFHTRPDHYHDDPLRRRRF